MRRAVGGGGGAPAEIWGRPKSYTPVVRRPSALNPDPGASMRSLRPALLALACCAASAPLAAADSGRLSRDVVPTFESVHLVVDATKPGYAGSVRIDLRVNAATDTFQLNARKLRIETAT